MYIASYIALPNLTRNIEISTFYSDFADFKRFLWFYKISQDLTSNYHELNLEEKQQRLLHSRYIQIKIAMSIFIQSLFIRITI